MPDCPSSAHLQLVTATVAAAPLAVAAAPVALAAAAVALAAASVALATASPACARHMLRPNSHELRGFEKRARVSQGLD